MARVFIPFNLRKHTGDVDQLDVPGATLGRVIDNLEERFPGIKEHLVEDGRLKPGVSAVCGHAATRRGSHAAAAGRHGGPLRPCHLRRRLEGV